MNERSSKPIRTAAWLGAYLVVSSLLYGGIASALSSPRPSASLIERIALVPMGALSLLPFALVLAFCSLPYVALIIVAVGAIERRSTTSRLSHARLANVCAGAVLPLAWMMWSMEKRYMAWVAYLASWLRIWTSKIVLLRIRRLRAEFGNVPKSGSGDRALLAAFVVIAGIVQSREVAVRETVTSAARRLASEAERRAVEMGTGAEARQVSYQWAYDAVGDSKRESEVLLALQAYPCTVVTLRSDELARVLKFFKSIRASSGTVSSNDLRRHRANRAGVCWCLEGSRTGRFRRAIERLRRLVRLSSSRAMKTTCTHSRHAEVAVHRRTSVERVVVVGTGDGDRAMRTSDEMQRCLLALNAVLAMARNMSIEDGCSERVVRLLDHAELMPILLADPARTQDDLLNMLRDIADEFPLVTQLALGNYQRGWHKSV